MRPIVVMALLLGIHGVGRAEEITVRLTYLGPDKPSPFHGQLYVRVSNDGYTSASLLDKIKMSTLLVDGHPFKRTDAAFAGPEGLPVKGSWEGCMALEDYVPEGLTPGSHRLQLQLGSSLSEEIHVRVKKLTPAAASPQEARKQVDTLSDDLTPGLLRSCVENWLTDRDGGLSTIGATRYYVDPGVKVLISYEPSQPEPRVKGRIRTYLESRIAD